MGSKKIRVGILGLWVILGKADPPLSSKLLGTSGQPMGRGPEDLSEASFTLRWAWKNQERHRKSSETTRRRPTVKRGEPLDVLEAPVFEKY